MVPLDNVINIGNIPLQMDVANHPVIQIENVMPVSELSQQETEAWDKATQVENPDTDATTIQLDANQPPILGIPITPLNDSPEPVEPLESPPVTPIKVEDIISASAQFADICKCGPNKCKPHGRCCNGCPGMEGHYCHEGTDDDLTSDIENGEDAVTSYTISVEETQAGELIPENEISFLDASCQTEEAVCPTECSGMVSLGKETLSLYKEFQHTNGGCCVHS